jgi:hypothetical protein
MTEVSLERAESRLNELQQAIDSALAARDYECAADLQSALRQTTAKCDRLRAQQADATNDEQIAGLEETRESEQAQILAGVEDRLSEIRDYFRRTYDEIEQRHADALEGIQTRFSRPAYMSIKVSPTIRALRHAEAFYVRTEDYCLAARVRRQIEQQTRAEVSEFKAATRSAIEAKVRDARHQYELERASFAQRLRNDQNIIKRDADRRILAIENKYRRIYHQLTHKAEHTFELTAKFRNELHEVVNRNLAEFVAELQGREQQTGNEEEDREITTLPRPLSARRREPRAGSVSRQRNPRVEMVLAKAHQQVDLVQKLSEF